jgi:hypothetical protein
MGLRNTAGHIDGPMESYRAPAEILHGYRGATELLQWSYRPPIGRTHGPALHLGGRYSHI